MEVRLCWLSKDASAIGIVTEPGIVAGGVATKRCGWWDCD
jgi:hypothetical protein